jgi:hypothetical protein
MSFVVPFVVVIALVVIALIAMALSSTLAAIRLEELHRGYEEPGWQQKHNPIPTNLQLMKIWLFGNRDRRGIIDFF